VATEIPGEAGQVGLRRARLGSDDSYSGYPMEFFIVDGEYLLMAKCCVYGLALNVSLIGVSLGFYHRLSADK
jgi:hypothetical protein